MHSLKLVGDTYKDFKVIHVQEISELQLVLKELIHTPTGATVLHLENDDPENVFCLSFQTLPSSSDGVAHVLEHTVLCGSKKFPVKDPFFAMSRRSLNTYMNALTGSDFTCYPAATQVPADFYNLLDVYIDAVFHPKLMELSFLQEGWRYAFAEDGSLQYQGIVFNEMKGSLASPDARLWKKMMRYLFPTLPYGFNSGGNPTDIPQLTYKNLIDFHKTYYHPGRCLYFFYGNLPLQGHLDFIQENALKGVEKVPALPLIPREKRFLKPLYKEGFYPSHEKGEDIISIGYLTCPITEQEDLLALHVLELILMGTDSGPLKHALLQSKLCKQADCFIESDITEAPFVFIFKGCTEGSAEKIDALIQKTIKEVIKEGISIKQIESAIHQLEIAKSEITGTHSPFGLSLFLRSGLLKQHGVPPADGLKIHTLFESLRQGMEDPYCLNKYLTRYFLDNPHKVVLTLKPDTELSNKEEEAEKAKLKEIQAQLTPKEIEEIVKKNQALEALQELQENADLEVLPKVTLNDVDDHPRKLLLVEERVGDLDVFHHDCFTNQIVYADLHFDAPTIRIDELPYLRLFTCFLTEMGTGGRDYRKNLEYIQEHLGGIGAFYSLNQNAKDSNLLHPTFGIRGKALYRKIDKLFILFTELLTSIDFKDVNRLHDLLKQHHSSIENGINNNALKYALSLSTSGLNEASQINYQMYGLEYLYSLRKIIKDFESDPNILIDHFYALQNKLLGLKEAKLVLSLDESAYDLLKAENFFGLPQKCNKPKSPFNHEVNVPKIHSQGRVIASPISFTAMSLPMIPYDHPDSPYLSIASHIFENKVLHKRIREQGGAYGAGASSNPSTGAFTFYTYRDPNISSSLQAFKDAASSIVAGEFDKKDIEEAQLGIIQELDGPLAPGSRASVAFSWQITGKTYKARQEFRKKLLEASKEQVQKAVKEHILSQMENAPFVTFASKELLTKECPTLPLHTV